MRLVLAGICRARAFLPAPVVVRRKRSLDAQSPAWWNTGTAELRVEVEVAEWGQVAMAIGRRSGRRRVNKKFNQGLIRLQSIGNP
jgi:hypothetical protein